MTATRSTRKAAAVLPRAILPGQICGPCQKGDHGNCAGIFCRCPRVDSSHAKAKIREESCTHAKTLSLYRRGSRDEGRGFIPDAARCRQCGALLERAKGVGSGRGS